MSEFLFEYYLWIKSLHVIAVIAWMAGMLYLPRLYVYHVEQGQSSAIAPIFQTMERRLLRYITNPAMIASFIFGGLMIWANPDLMKDGWFHAKLTAVILLTVVHVMLARYRKQLLAGTCQKSARYFRVLNEVPTLLMIAIIVLVIVKPF